MVDGVRPLQSCSECYHFKKWPQGGKEAYFSNIHYDNSVTPIMAFFDNWRNAIFSDLDGTLTGNNGPRWVTCNMPHLRLVDGCVLAPAWDDGIICSKKLTRLDFYAPLPAQDFRGINIQIITYPSDGLAYTTDATTGARVPTAGTTFSPAGAYNFDFMTNSQSKKIKSKEQDNAFGFVAVVAQGVKYNLKFNSDVTVWRAGIDWRHFLVGLSESWQTTDDAIIAEFSYIDVRELYEMYRMIGGRNDNVAKDIPGNYPLHQLVTDAEKATMTPSQCNFGDFIHDQDAKTLTVCFSGRGRVTNLDKVDMNGLPCKLACPVPSADCVKETRARKWNVAEDWYHYYDSKNPTLFIDYGKPDNRTVLCEWRMFIEPDVNNVVDITVKNLTIRGSLKFASFDSGTKITLRSSGINIWGGEFILGEPTAPFLGQAVIEMDGVQIDNTPFVYDSVIDVGN